MKTISFKTRSPARAAKRRPYRHIPFGRKQKLQQEEIANILHSDDAQKQLTIEQANDKQELEADRAAEQVMRATINGQQTLNTQKKKNQTDQMRKETNSNIVQRKVKYIEQVKGEESKPFFEKFDNSIKEISTQIQGLKGAEAVELNQALTLLKSLHASGKITLWYTSGGLHYASYDNASGEIRLHITHGSKATAATTLVHEAIHALHAVRYPKLAAMYAKILEAGGTTNKNQAITLLKFKAWTEYWAYQRTAVYNNLRQTSDMQSDPHKAAMNEKGVKHSIKRVEEQIGKPFEPWKWNPPVKYKIIK